MDEFPVQVLQDALQGWQVLVDGSGKVPSPQVNRQEPPRRYRPSMQERQLLERVPLQVSQVDSHLIQSGMTPLSK